MIDLFCIFTTGGLILWTKSFVTYKFENVLNELIKTILMEEKKNVDYYVPKDKNGIILRWKILNEAGLIFVTAYQQSYGLLYIDKLLDMVVKDFREKRLNILEHIKNVYLTEISEDYNQIFLSIMKKWENLKSELESSKPNNYNNNQFNNDTLKSANTVMSNNMNDSSFKRSQTASPGSAVPTIQRRSNQNKLRSTPNNQKTKKGKEKRIWDDSPKNIDQKTMEQYDMSKSNNKANDNEVNKFKKQFLGPADPDSLNETNFDLIDSSQKSTGIFSRLSSKLKNYIGNKVLTEEDLDPIMENLSTLLMEKNVAKEIADNLCMSVKKSLLNTKTNSFTTITTTVKEALKESIAKILTPKEDLDVLRQALASKKRGEPYKIVFIGVNGVGKSTNLAKVAYLLMNNGLKVLIAACDNFRSGAVEQLKTHCAALNVDLFEKGYKDDPAYICKEAIEEAKKNSYDCVLIDTAGRMQDNEPLMKSLAKLVEINEPDTILFVGEALTGNDSVDQLMKFNQSLIDYSKKDKPRTIDGILLTKFDTVDDKVGAALTMVYTTGKPIVFVGTGQKYVNLKKLNVNNVLNAIFG